MAMVHRALVARAAARPRGQGAQRHPHARRRDVQDVAELRHERARHAPGTPLQRADRFGVPRRRPHGPDAALPGRLLAVAGDHAAVLERPEPAQRSTPTSSCPTSGRAQQQIVRWGIRYAGYPYVWGGEWGLETPEPSALGGQPRSGFDCSGLTWWLLRGDDGGYWNVTPPRPYAGWSLPQRTSADMAAMAPTKADVRRAAARRPDVLRRRLQRHGRPRRHLHRQRLGAGLLEHAGRRHDHVGGRAAGTATTSCGAAASCRASRRPRSPSIQSGTLLGAVSERARRSTRVVRDDTDSDSAATQPRLRDDLLGGADRRRAVADPPAGHGDLLVLPARAPGGSRSRSARSRSSCRAASASTHRSRASSRYVR